MQIGIVIFLVILYLVIVISKKLFPNETVERAANAAGIVGLALALLVFAFYTTSIRSKNWAVTFERQFPPDYWSNGDHTYTLESSCPLAADLPYKHGVWTNSFQVSPEATLISGNIYLRWDGLSDESIGGDSVDSITSTQPITVVYTFTDSTSKEAEWFSKNCEVTFKPDDGTVYKLVAGKPFKP